MKVWRQLIVVCAVARFIFFQPAHAELWHIYWAEGGVQRAVDLDTIQEVGPNQRRYVFRYSNPTGARAAVVTSDCRNGIRGEAGDSPSRVEQGSPNAAELGLACASQVRIESPPNTRVPSSEPNAVSPSPSFVAPAPKAPPRPAGRGVQSSGSGFYVTDSGHIITNDHVVEGCNAVDVIVEGKPVSTTVVARSHALDLAILRLSQPVRTLPLPLSSSQPRAGESIAVVGFPLSDILGEEPRITSGIVSSTSGVQGDRNFVQISAAVQPGNSGGPLLDETGFVIGIVNARLAERFKAENVNFAIKSSLVRSFLEVNGLAQSAPTQSKRPLPLTDVARRARQSMVLIQCR